MKYDEEGHYRIITNKYMILFKEIFSRKMVIVKNYSNVIYIYQERNGEVIERKIFNNDISYSPEISFKYVIGKYVFIPFFRGEPSFDIGTDVYEKEFFEEIELKNYETGDGYIEGENIIVINNKWGILELPKSKYIIRRL